MSSPDLVIVEPSVELQGGIMSTRVSVRISTVLSGYDALVAEGEIQALPPQAADKAKIALVLVRE